MEFKEIIKNLRKEYGISQDELGKRIGMARSSVANYENGQNFPSTDILLKLSEVFNCSTDYLLGNSTNKQNQNNLLDKLFLIPIVGKVPAGEPLLAEDNIEGYLPIDPMMYNLSSPDNLFFLKVVGESMNNIVPNGSFVLVRKQDSAEDGDVIVAIVNGDDEATLKRFKQLESSFVMLEPDSTFPEYTPRIVNLRDTEFKIIGKVIGDFKKWS